METIQHEGGERTGSGSSKRVESERLIQNNTFCDLLMH